MHQENRHLYSFTTSISDYVSADHNNVVQRNGLCAKHRDAADPISEHASHHR